MVSSHRFWRKSPAETYGPTAMPEYLYCFSYLRVHVLAPVYLIVQYNSTCGYCAIVDLEKTHGRVNMTKFWKVLSEYEWEEWLVNVVQIMYGSSKAYVRVN